jgi:putative transposase
MDKQQPILPKDFFKQFKNKEEFNSFFNQLFKQGVEEMLRGELDEHLGYQKTAPREETRVTVATAATKRP